MDIPNISELLALLEVQDRYSMIHSTYIQDEHLDLWIQFDICVPKNMFLLHLFTLESYP